MSEESSCDYRALWRCFPRGILVRKTPEYPQQWTEREVHKSAEGVVVGYGRTPFRSLKVRRIGTVVPVDSEPEWWEVVTS